MLALAQKQQDRANKNAILGDPAKYAENNNLGNNKKTSKDVTIGHGLLDDDDDDSENNSDEEDPTMMMD